MIQEGFLAGGVSSSPSKLRDSPIPFILLSGKEYPFEKASPKKEKIKKRERVRENDSAICEAGNAGPADPSEAHRFEAKAAGRRPSEVAGGAIVFEVQRSSRSEAKKEELWRQELEALRRKGEDMAKEVDLLKQKLI
ncbi:hypothetical protein HPP92_024306 [Vanilla planifolia]|uniref:Uncharacterized protein n=1 Tax=Vanilla planifolia TaxID=51239 RepID=A0A835UCU1_VANPL|nr:hypothetical protein HPP92_024306 [Vanilla planifolia]